MESNQAPRAYEEGFRIANRALNIPLVEVTPINTKIPREEIADTVSFWLDLLVDQTGCSRAQLVDKIKSRLHIVNGESLREVCENTPLQKLVPYLESRAVLPNHQIESISLYDHLRALNAASGNFAEYAAVDANIVVLEP